MADQAMMIQKKGWFCDSGKLEICEKFGHEEYYSQELLGNHETQNTESNILTEPCTTG